MKRYYLVMTVVWGVAALAWSAGLVKAIQAGTVNTFHIVFELCMVMCSVVNLFIYLKLRKKK